MDIDHEKNNYINSHIDTDCIYSFYNVVSLSSFKIYISVRYFLTILILTSISTKRGTFISSSFLSSCYLVFTSIITIHTGLAMYFSQDQAMSSLKGTDNLIIVI